MLRSLPCCQMLVMNILAGEGWDRLCPFLREARAQRGASARSFLARAPLTFGNRSRRRRLSTRAPQPVPDQLFPWVDPRKRQRSTEKNYLRQSREAAKDAAAAKRAASNGTRLTKRYRCRMNVTFEYWRDNNCNRTMFPKRFGRNATPTRVSALNGSRGDAIPVVRPSSVELPAWRPNGEEAAAVAAPDADAEAPPDEATAAAVDAAAGDDDGGRAAELAAKAALDALAEVDPDPHEAAADAAESAETVVEVEPVRRRPLR